jgi:hypothetical protein
VLGSADDASDALRQALELVELARIPAPSRSPSDYERAGEMAAAWDRHVRLAERAQVLAAKRRQLVTADDVRRLVELVLGVCRRELDALPLRSAEAVAATGATADQVEAIRRSAASACGAARQSMAEAIRDAYAARRWRDG